MESREGYSKILIEKNLKQFGAEIKSKGNEEYLKIKDKISPIYISNGIIDEENFKKITKIVSEKTGKRKEEVYDALIKKPNFYSMKKPSLERVVGFTVAVLCIGLITLILSKTTLTGFAINNIPNTTANIGILICIVGIIGLLYWKFKKK